MSSKWVKEWRLKQGDVVTFTSELDGSLRVKPRLAMDAGQRIDQYVIDSRTQSQDHERGGMELDDSIKNSARYHGNRYCTSLLAEVGTVRQKEILMAELEREKIEFGKNEKQPRGIRLLG